MPQSTRQTLQDLNLPEDSYKPGRISKRLDRAIVQIVTEGASITAAAESTGYPVPSLTRALKRPHVIARKQDIIKAFMLSATDLARVSLVDLLRSKSDDIRLRAACRLLDMAGETVQNRNDNNGLTFGDVTINVLAARPDQINNLTSRNEETVIIQAVRREPFNNSD